MVQQKSDKENKKFTTIRLSMDNYLRLIKFAVGTESIDEIFKKVLDKTELKNANY